MNYQQAIEYKNINGEQYLELKKVIFNLIENKKVIISQELINNFGISDCYQLIFEPYGDENYFTIKRKERLLGLILIDLMGKSLNKKISSNLEQLFNEIDQYLLLIKQPKPNVHWYHHLDKEIIEFALLELKYNKNIDLLSILDPIKNDEDPEKQRKIGKHSYRYESYFLDIINELDLELTDFYQYISKYCNDAQYTSYALTAIEEYCINLEKGVEMYQYGRANKSEEVKLFNATCLIEISKFDIDFAHKEAMSLINISKEDSIKSLSFFEYDTPDRLSKSFDFIFQNDFEHNDRVTFYFRALGNKIINEDLIKRCFNEITTQFNIKSPDLHRHLLRWIGLVNGYDMQKNKLLEVLLDNNIQLNINEYFGNYENKSFVFEFLKDKYGIVKGTIQNYKSILNQIYSENTYLFEKEVLKLLSSENIHDASLAIEIIKSKYYGIYDLPYLELSESEQMTVLQRISTEPFNIKDLFPSLSKFGHTKHTQVFNAFKEKCFDYIDAYGSEFIKLFDRYFDKDKFADLHAELKVYNDTLEDHFLLKKSIKEFSPYNNYYQPYKRYLEYDHRKMALMQEHFRTREQSSFGLFKNISVIRGSAFKSEQSNVITKMDTFSTSRLLDKRIYEDPIKYEENYNNLFKPEEK